MNIKLLCLKPVPITSPQGSFLADCGHCSACRARKAAMWSGRMLDEYTTQGGRALFVTLTYKPSEIPEGMLSKRDLQLYFKRLRKQGLKFKYFAVGEYGRAERHPHYHIVFYGLDQRVREILFQTWGKSLRIAFSCETPDIYHPKRSMSYVSGYVQKKLGKFFAETYESLHNQKSPFQLVSKGIGKDFCMKYLSHIIDGVRKLPDGKSTLICRYYRKLLGITYDKFKWWIDEETANFKREHHVVYNWQVDQLLKDHRIACDDLLRAYACKMDTRAFDILQRMAA